MTTPDLILHYAEHRDVDGDDMQRAVDRRRTILLATALYGFIWYVFTCLVLARTYLTTRYQLVWLGISATVLFTGLAGARGWISTRAARVIAWLLLGVMIVSVIHYVSMRRISKASTLADSAFELARITLIWLIGQHWLLVMPITVRTGARATMFRCAAFVGACFIISALLTLYPNPSAAIAGARASLAFMWGIADVLEPFAGLIVLTSCILALTRSMRPRTAAIISALVTLSPAAVNILNVARRIDRPDGVLSLVSMVLQSAMRGYVIYVLAWMTYREARKGR